MSDTPITDEVLAGCPDNFATKFEAMYELAKRFENQIAESKKALEELERICRPSLG